MADDNKDLVNKAGEANLLDELLENPFANEPVPQNKSVTETKTERRLIDVLPEENKQKAYELADQIDPTKHEALISYGTEAQTKLLSFSEKMIEHVQKKDAGEVGEIINDLMKKLQDVNPDDLNVENKSFFGRIFGKLSGSFKEMMSKYQKTGAQIDRITVKLERSKNSLVSDISLLEQLYENNKDYFHALNIYIAAGELKLEQLNNETIPKLQQEASATKDQMKIQEINDMMQFANRLDKRLHDLKLSREITIQSAPQIRLIQNTNQALVEKVQSSIMTAIPLWKNQVAIALTLVRQRHAVEAQKKVSETTNELLLKNAEMLKTNMVETAKENERGLVDIDTLKKTQESLITTLEETMKIQEEGRLKRRQAEAELTTMETELREKLLEIKG